MAFVKNPNITEAKNFRFKFSTVDEYFTALWKSKEQYKIEFPTHSGDFIPYNGVYVGTYWTGYFTSRPNFKRLVRDYTWSA